MDRCESQGAGVEKQKPLAARARLSQPETRHSRLEAFRPGKLGSYKNNPRSPVSFPTGRPHSLTNEQSLEWTDCISLPPFKTAPEKRILGAVAMT